jgi:hypothetical protein
LKHWCETNIPEGNLFTALMTTLFHHFGSLDNTKFPRIPRQKNRFNLEEILQSNAVDILKQEIECANKKNTTQKIIDRMALRIPGINQESANTILQVAVLSKIVTNTKHNIGNQNLECKGVIRYLTSLGVTNKQHRTTVLRNIPNVLNMPGQRLESSMDSFGSIHEDYVDIIYDGMELYDVKPNGHLVTIFTHS